MQTKVVKREEVVVTVEDSDRSFVKASRAIDGAVTVETLTYRFTFSTYKEFDLFVSMLNEAAKALEA